MYLNSKQPMVLDIKDLLYVLLKKSIVILLVGVVMACALFSYKMMSRSNTNSTDNSIDLFDISNKLEGESDVNYSERVLDVERAKDIINCIDVLKKQIENNRKYVSDSVFMQIDSENEAVSTASFLISINGSQKNRSDIALVSTYRQYILSGEYLTELSKETGINQGYLTELVSVSYDNSSIVVNTNEDPGYVGVVTVSVIGPTVEFTDKVLDSVLDSVENISFEMNNAVVSHSISFATRQSSYRVDSSTRDKQINITNRFESLQQQINNYDKSLETIASKYGVEKSRWYAYFSFNDLSSVDKPSSMKSVVKYTLLGFILGVFIACVIITLKYVFSNKFSTQANFFCRYHSVKKIGVVKPQYKRNNFVVLIDKKSGDDDNLSLENSYRLLSANIKNITKEMGKVLFTGTADFNRIETLIKELGVDADVKASFFIDPACLESISDYDGVIIVEQRNYSDCRFVDEEIKLISNTNTELIGAIVI